MAIDFYKTGTVAVEAGEREFVGTGTLWLPSNVKPGDVMNVAGALMIIETLEDGQHGTFANPWGGDTDDGLTYSIAKTSAAWGTNREIALDTAELIRLLTVGQQFEWIIALSHENGEISADDAVVTLPVPKDIEVASIAGWVNEASSSGNISIDVNLNGVSVFSQDVTIEQGEHSSDTASTQPVLVQKNWDRGGVLTIDIDAAGVGAEGAKLIINGQRRS